MGRERIPDGLTGENIPLLARIMQTADIYDALTTARSYKCAVRPEEALRAMEEEARRGWRDAYLVSAFSEIASFANDPRPRDAAQFNVTTSLANLIRELTKYPVMQTG